jgi:hypothetical protein
MHLPVLDGLAALAGRQCGVVTRSQLRGLGATAARIDSELSGKRWSAVTPAVLTLHNHAPTREQWMWVALLDAPGSAALCSHTSLALHGMRVFADEGSFIHLLVPTERGCAGSPASWFTSRGGSRSPTSTTSMASRALQPLGRRSMLLRGSDGPGSP